MKKLFFFRSSTPSNGSNHSSPPSSKEKQSTDKNSTKNKTSSSSPSLRKSRSYSSGIFNESGLGEKSSFLYSSKVSQDKTKHQATCCGTLTPERKSRGKSYEDVVQNSHGLENPEVAVTTGASFDSSESSSYCSSIVSSKVLDRYIDGEELLISNAQNNPPFQGTRVGYGNGGVKRPPRVHYTAPVAIDVGEPKPRSQSFRETKASKDYFSTRDWVENGFAHESPRKLAKHVIERLSQSHTLPEVSSKELNSDVPITIEDIYGGPLNRLPSLHSDGDQREMFSVSERSHLSGEKHRDMNSAETEEDTDLELLERSKEAEERAVFLSNELEQETYVRGGGFNISGLVQTIKSLAEERFNLAFEVSAVLKDQVVERASAKEGLRLSRLELDSRTRRLEKEKNELQTSLEKELDRRSNEWSSKLEKYQAEENRLRDRVRELAEQNVTLQREVSSFRERDSDGTIQITSLEQQINDLNERLDEERTQNHNLKLNISGIQEKYAAIEEKRDCIRKNYNEKENECKELHRCITRMLRTCNEQEKTIEGLREGLGKEVKKQNFLENFDSKFGKLKMELMRLTGVEQALRKEVESYKHEVDSLRQENINLLHRLKGSKEGGSLFKIDQELWNRVCCLQNQGPKLLNESIQLCYKLLDHIKEKAGCSSDVKQGFEITKNGLDGQFVIESDMKLQGFERGAENLIRSLQTVSSVLQEKASIVESQSHGLRDESGQLINDHHLEDKIKSELKAEILLTSLLREKLYSKELDMEQLQAELAAAVRGNDILQCELQNALDTLSCVTHKMKGLELQMINKDESINRLEKDLQERTKDLTIVRGILPKVSEERDLMWDEVKLYSEKNMLLNCEVNVLKKKVETLDEDILIKEGQITILKDSLGNKPFDILHSSPDSTGEFLLE